jgi:NTP pyrophosphatase (non-canonical NTP hydrolase)
VNVREVPRVATLDEYQAEAMRTAETDFAFVERGDRTDRLVLAALGMAGEAGELVELVKKHVFHGRPLERAAVVKELGDELWYLALAASAVGATLGEVAQTNVAKLRARYPDGFSPQASTERRDVR